MEPRFGQRGWRHLPRPDPGGGLQLLGLAAGGGGVAVVGARLLADVAQQGQVTRQLLNTGVRNIQHGCGYCANLMVAEVPVEGCVKYWAGVGEGEGAGVPAVPALLPAPRLALLQVGLRVLELNLRLLIVAVVVFMLASISSSPERS